MTVMYDCVAKLHKYRMSCICHVTHGTRWDEKVAIWDEKVTIWDEMGRKWDEMGRKWDGKVTRWDEKKETASYRLLLYIYECLFYILIQFGLKIFINAIIKIINFR